MTEHGGDKGVTGHGHSSTEAATEKIFTCVAPCSNKQDTTKEDGAQQVTELHGVLMVLGAEERRFSGSSKHREVTTPRSSPAVGRHSMKPLQQ